MADLNGKNLMFLSGTGAKVTELRAKGGAIEGAFYLTNDTNRLYIGTNVGTTEVPKIIPEPVNEGVITVAKTTDLPAVGAGRIPGQFYYVEDGGILCVYSKNQWVQINPDTKLKSESFTLSKDETKKKVTVTHQTFDTTDTDTILDSFELIEGAGVKLSVDGKTITISSSGTGGVALTLTTAQGTDNSSAKLNQHTVVTAADGKTTESDDTVVIKAGTEIESVIAGTKEITINAKKQTLKPTGGLTFSADETAGFILNAEHRNGDTSTSDKLDPTITIGKEGNKSEAIHYVNGNADLDVYTVAQADAKITEEINKKIATADAMTFKGTAGGASGALPAITECSNGDTYKVASALTETDLKKVTGVQAGTTVKVGDLLIASGTEDETTGKLKTGSFVHVPSGNEYETKVNLVTNGIELTDNAQTPTTLGGIKVAAGKQITVADTEAGNVKTVTVNHSDITTATETATAEEYGILTDNKRSKTITVVKSIEVDNGHVTKIVTDQEVIDDTDVALDKVTQTATAATPDKDIKVETIVHDKKGRTTTGGNFNFKSDTIKLAADGASMSMNLVWGSF